MSKSNKGFTLVELLTVIVVLAIILAIAIPSVLNVISNTKVDAYKKSQEMMVKAVKNYTGLYIHLLPTNIGDTVEIALENLQNNNYIDTIKNPAENSQECNGYVIITKISDSLFDYTPHLDCNNGAGSALEDGLVGHWKFDDFQESTTNVIPNPQFFSSGWGSYNNGNDGSFNTEFGVEGLNLINRRSWSGAEKGIILPSPGTYTISVWVKPISRTYSSIEASLYVDGGGLNDQMVFANWSTDKVGKWQKLEMTRTFTSTNIYLYLICFGGLNAAGYEISAQYTMPQIEKKEYSTPFVEGTRNGTVKDYSGNGNIANLDAVTTPQWVSDAKVGSGAYRFKHGVNYINVGNNSKLNLTTTGTIMIWAKANRNYPSDSTSNTFRTMISKTFGGATGQISYVLNWSGSNSTRNLRGTIGDSNGQNEVIVSNYDLGDNWHHIVLTWDGSKLILYADGKEVGRTNQTRNAQVISNDVYIGRGYNTTTSNYNFDGWLDNAKIYNRALTADEINLIYKTENK